MGLPNNDKNISISDLISDMPENERNSFVILLNDMGIKDPSNIGFEKARDLLETRIKNEEEQSKNIMDHIKDNLTEYGQGKIKDKITEPGDLAIIVSNHLVHRTTEKIQSFIPIQDSYEASFLIVESINQKLHVLDSLYNKHLEPKKTSNLDKLNIVSNDGENVIEIDKWKKPIYSDLGSDITGDRTKVVVTKEEDKSIKNGVNNIYGEQLGDTVTKNNSLNYMNVNLGNNDDRGIKLEDDYTSTNVKEKSFKKLTNYVSSKLNNDKVLLNLKVIGVGLIGAGSAIFINELYQNFIELPGLIDQLENMSNNYNNAKEAISSIEFQSADQYQTELSNLNLDIKELANYEKDIPNLESLISKKQDQNSMSGFLWAGAFNIAGTIALYIGLKKKTTNFETLDVEYSTELDNKIINKNTGLKTYEINKSELVTPDDIELDYVTDLPNPVFESDEILSDSTNQILNNPETPDYVSSSEVFVWDLYETHMRMKDKEINPKTSLRLQRLYEETFKDGVSAKSGVQVAKDFGCAKTTIYSNVKLLNELTGENYSFGKK